jgi:DNA mismatch repair ATPase MutS
MQKIHNYIFKIKKYIEYTLEIIKYHRLKSDKLTKYKLFNEELEQHTNILVSLNNELSKITPFCFSFNKINEIGHIMCCFYQLYDNPIYNNAILYSFGFNGYFSIMSNLETNISENKLVKTTFITEGKPVFKKMYYPKFINEDKQNIIKNDCDLNKNIIITGPNASGKTTTLKSALINIILSQQIGFGCYKHLKLKPYDNLHCYLNIPDTSGRDSLFQAEARRCKEIIDCIDHNKDLTHFCIFDELYSGTNPEEAVVSANAFMEYIVKNPNVTCILTTHYIKLCKQLSKNKMIKNFNMRTLKKNDNFEYTYELYKGISKVKGGLKVLHDMKYPKEILELTQSKIL